MKHIFIFLVAVTISVGSFAQITWDRADADTARGFETTDDIKTHNVITLAQAGDYRWVRTYSQSCSIESAICDKNQCYLTTTDSADFKVEANESFDMICHFYPNQKCCPEGAIVTLKVFKIEDPNVTSTATYVLDLWCQSLSVTYSDSKSFEIAPNPVTTTLTILNSNSIDNIAVTNVVGETVIEKTSIVNNTVDVSSLKPGVYWVTVQSGNTTFTKRFLKQ